MPNPLPNELIRHKQIRRDSISLCLACVRELRPVKHVIANSVANLISVKQKVSYFVSNRKPLPPCGVILIHSDYKTVRYLGVWTYLTGDSNWK